MGLSFNILVIHNREERKAKPALDAHFLWIGYYVHYFTYPISINHHNNPMKIICFPYFIGETTEV